MLFVYQTTSISAAVRKMYYVISTTATNSFKVPFQVNRFYHINVTSVHTFKTSMLFTIEVKNKFMAVLIGLGFYLQ